MKMSSYCKAYTAGRLREFDGWTEAAENARVDDSFGDEPPTDGPRPLTDESVLYLHDTFIVTDGICLDEHVIFDAVTPEWRKFCSERLGFRVPEDLARAQQTEDQASPG